MKLEGEHAGRLTAAQVEAIDRLFADRGYFDLADAYVHADMTDMPSVTTSYSAGGRTKTIEHYRGDQSAPAVLSEIEAGLDGIVAIEQWIGTEEERAKLGR